MVRNKKVPVQNNAQCIASSSRTSSLIDFNTGSNACEVNTLKKKKPSKKVQTLHDKLKEAFECKLKLINDNNKSNEIHCLFGEYDLKIDLESTGEFTSIDNEKTYILFIGESCQSVLYIEKSLSSSNEKGSADESSYELTEILPLTLWKSLSNKSQFQIVLSRYENCTLTVKIYLLKKALLVCMPSETLPAYKALSEVCHYFYGIEYSKEIENKHSFIDSEVLYQEIKNYHSSKQYYEGDVQHASLIPMLRPYQTSAVKWMLAQELNLDDIDSKNDLHKLYIEIISKDGKTLYYNKFGGYFIKEKPLMLKRFPGGILADEMGLGKTVEILACILNNPYQEKTNESELMATNVPDNETSSSSIESSYIKPLLLHELPVSDCNTNITNGLVCNEPVIIHEHTMDTSTSLDLTVDVKSENNSEMDNYKDEDMLEMDFEEHKICAGPSSSESHNTSGRSKRNRSSINYAENFDNKDHNFESKDQNFESKAKKRKINKFDADREIAECPVKSAIEKVIINIAWEDVFSDYKKEGSYNEYRKFLKGRNKDPLYMMSLKERLNIQYLNSIETYSAVNCVNASRSKCKDFFETKVKQKSYFECVCGNDESQDYDSKDKIQCSVCKLYQHATCVHYNKRDPKMGEYICPHCWSVQPPVPSGATLIISPSSICYQWQEEIKKHLNSKSLKVFVYNGVASHGYVQPKELYRHDIVITTYEVLRRELNYVDLPHSNSEAGRKFRYPKRFMAIPSPLPCIEWWRICLDEAQMVECVTTKTAEMCLRLKANIKWCITGTPIQKSIKDLQGLLMFLNVDPYGIPKWWNLCLNNFYSQGIYGPLHEVMVQHMWRTSKKDVLDQLGLPTSTEEVHWLNFTPVENHFYKRLHAECSSDAINKLKRFSDTNVLLKSLDRHTLFFLLQPLLKLRQACNHPQVVKGNFLAMNKKTMTMDQLLENLIKKTQLEAEDAHRIIIASLNGLAALHVIKNEFNLAVQKYRETMLAIEEDGKNLKTDLLQKLHTLHNLSEVIQTNPDGVERTLRDDSLIEEAKLLREKYLKDHPTRIEEAKTECTQVTSSIRDLHKKMKNKSWWLIGLEDIDHDFVLELREELLSHYSRFQEHQCIMSAVQSQPQLMKLVSTEVSKLQNQRTKMIDGIMALSSIDDYSSLVNSAIDCHLRPADTDAPKCTLCIRHELFEALENTLFFMKDTKIMRKTDTSKEVVNNIENLDVTRKGNWGLGEVEKILKYLQTKCLGRVHSSVHEDSQHHLNMVQNMKKEFKLYRVFWRTIYDYVSAIDEVNMATLRYRLKFPDEAVPQRKKKEVKDLFENKDKDIPNYILEEIDLPQVELKLKSDQIINKNELRTKMSQLLYLNNLKTSEMSREGDFNPDSCPICKCVLGEKWSVLQCGHCFCITCITIYLSKFVTNDGERKCPLCRQPTKAKDITYVSMSAKKTEEEMKLQGSLSTKFEGVIRAILKIKADDPEAKVLVFSSWSDVIEVLSEGLVENGITFRLLIANKKFQAALESFKSKQEITVLLMPLSLGANGLNLTEACHVILVEPILNPAAEVQAIGRIHRIGQKKPTVVHRFLVRSTIEERMHHILSPLHQADCNDDHSITIGNLRMLFQQPQNEHSDSP